MNLESKPPRAPAPTPPRTSIEPESELTRLSIAPAAPATLRGRRIALSVVLLLALLLVASVIAPLWVGIAFGTMMAFTAQRGFRLLAARLGNRRELAAAITTVLVGLVVAAVGALAIYALSKELFAVTAILRQKLAQGTLDALIGERLAAVVDRAGVDRVRLMARLGTELSEASGFAAREAADIVQATGSALLGLLIALLTMYYVLLEWPRLPARLEHLLPLDPRHTHSLIFEFRDVSKSALVGTIVTALIQGVLGGIGYALAGVPQPLTWGLFTALGSFIPLVGTASIFLPIAAWLAHRDHPASAVFVVIWGLLTVIGLADYVIRPRIVGGTGKGNPLLMLMSILGGLETFGITGLFIGPVLMTMFIAVLRIYEREMKHTAAAALAARAPGGVDSFELDVTQPTRSERPIDDSAR